MSKTKGSPIDGASTMTCLKQVHFPRIGDTVEELVVTADDLTRARVLPKLHPDPPCKRLGSGYRYSMNQQCGKGQKKISAGYAFNHIYTRQGPLRIERKTRRNDEFPDNLRENLDPCGLIVLERGLFIRRCSLERGPVFLLASLGCILCSLAAAPLMAQGSSKANESEPRQSSQIDRVVIFESKEKNLFLPKFTVSSKEFGEMILENPDNYFSLRTATPLARVIRDERDLKYTMRVTYLRVESYSVARVQPQFEVRIVTETITTNPMTSEDTAQFIVKELPRKDKVLRVEIEITGTPTRPAK